MAIICIYYLHTATLKCPKDGGGVGTAALESTAGVRNSYRKKILL